MTKLQKVREQIQAHKDASAIAEKALDAFSIEEFDSKCDKLAALRRSAP